MFTDTSLTNFQLIQTEFKKPQVILGDICPGFAGRES